MISALRVRSPLGRLPRSCFAKIICFGIAAFQSLAHAQDIALCKVDISLDKTTISIIERSTQVQRKYIPIGPDRVQSIAASPDERWSIVIFKVRGEARYGFIVIDQLRCEETSAIELSAPVEYATFEQNAVTFGLQGGKTAKFSLE